MADGKKKRLGILKTTGLGAVLVVVPLGIIGAALWQVVSLVKRLILPVFEWLPFDSTVTRVLVIVLALATVFAICFATGLAIRTHWGGSLRRWADRRLLEKIPGYSIIRTLVHQYLDVEDKRTFRPILIDLYGSDSRAIGFEIEVLGDGTVAVFLPSVPAATVGQLQIVPESAVTPLKASMHATLEALTMFGIGSGKLVDDDPATNPGDEGSGESGS